MTSTGYIVVAVLALAFQVCLLVSLVVLRTKRREALLQKDAMLRAVPDMMFLLSSDGVYLDYHIQDANSLQVPPSSFLGRNMREVLPPDLASRFEEAFAQASDQPVVVDYVVPVNGEIRHYEARLVRCGSDKILSVVRDVSVQKLAEVRAGALEDRARTQRVAALGELAASIAHELKQPLSAILTNAQACLRYLSHPSRNADRIQEALRDVVAEAGRATEIVDRTRELFKADEPLVVKPLVIDQTIDAALDSVRSRMQQAGIEVRTVLEPGLPPALGADVQVQQVLLSLVMNAYDALMHVDPRYRQITIAARLEHASHILISVSDTRGITGPGVAAVFNPPFTTKEHGMGLGLTVSRSIAEAHGGKLWATWNDGVGSTFWFTLPTPASVARPVSGVALPAAINQEHERGLGHRRHLAGGAIGRYQGRTIVEERRSLRRQQDGVAGRGPVSTDCSFDTV